MTKTRLECITQAMRQAGLTDVGEDPSAEDAAFAGKVIDGVFAELDNALSLAWTLSAIPENAFLPLATVVEADLRIAYGMPQAMPRGRALLRLRGELVPDNRTLIADLDDSGTISESEEGVRDRMGWY